MSRRTFAAGVCGLACVVVAVAAYAVVGGLPGLLYAGAVVMAGLFAAVKFGYAPGAREGRWQRKSVVIAELRAELEERDELVAELRRAHDAQEARIRELEEARAALQTQVDDERGRLERFLGELTGGIGQRGDELAALERELTTLAGG